MDEKSKAAMRAYQRAWRKSHPEKVRAYNERYWTRKAAQLEDFDERQQEQEDKTNEQNR